MKRTVLGLLYLVGACLAAYFLLFPGTGVLLAVTTIRAIESISPEADHGPTDASGLAISGAAMASTGFCLTVGLATMGIRKLTRRPNPRLRTVAICVLLSMALIGSSVFTVYAATKPAPTPAGNGAPEGAWQPGSSDKQIYRFHEDGSLDGWYSRQFQGKVGTWTRSGQTITVTHSRGWNFVGTLSGSAIKGTMTITSPQSYSGKEQWVRDITP